MAEGGTRLLRVTKARAVRSVAALSLLCSVASTGLAALAPASYAAVPAPVLTGSAPSSPGSDPTPQLDFVDEGHVYECRATPPSSAAWTVCTTPWDVPDLGADGSYVLAVRQQVVGDTGDELQVPYALDTVSEVTVTPPASPGNDTTPTWGISPEPSGTASCRFDGGPAADCSTGFTAPALTSDASYDLVVTPTDALGNPGAPITSTYVLDTTPPSAPGVSGSTGTDSDPALAWTWKNDKGDAATCTFHTPAGTGAPAPCTSDTSFTATGTADGDYSVDVVLTDAAGNTSSPVSVSPTYTLDRTPPPAPVFTSSPSSPGSSTTVTWDFTATGKTTTCLAVGPSSPSQSSFSCKSGTATVTLPNDDSWKLVVTTADAYGNAISTSSPAYLLDSTGPNAPVVTGPTTLSNNANPHFTWAGELPSTAVCRLVGPVTSTWTDCTARFYDPVLTLDGSYTVQAQLTDPLGNVGQVGTSATYRYDGTEPLAPGLTVPASPGNDLTPTVTFTTETGGTATCTVYPGTTAPASPTLFPCSSGSYTPTLVSDGTYTVSVFLTDQAGNVGPPSSWTYQLDTNGPTAAVISSPASPNFDRTPTWLLADDGASTLTCSLTGPAPATTVVNSPTTCSGSFTGNLGGKPQGSYTFTVVASDTAGNTATSTATYVLDTVAPSSPTVTGPASSLGNAATPTWTFPTQPQTTAQCRLVQGASQSAWSDCSSGSYAVSSPADGTYTVDVLVSDLAGNDAAIASSSPYTSDRTAPVAPTVAGPTGPGKNTSPSWSWTSEPGATSSCRLDRAAVIGSVVPCSSGTFSPTLTGDTSYVVSVFVTDAAGNVGPTTTLAAYVLDTGIPATPVVTGPTGTGSLAIVTWSWAPEAGSTSTCVLVRNGVAGAGAPCTSGTALTLPSDGTYLLRVSQRDAAGNSSPSGSSSSYVLDRAAPSTPVVSTPTSPSNVLTPSFAFTSEAGSTTQCRLLRGGSTVRDWATCATPVTYDLTGLPDGSYTVEVIATDAALNPSTTGTSLPYLLDTTPPDPITVAVPPTPSRDTTPTYTWPSETGATSMCRLVQNGVNLTAAPCTSPYTPTLTDGSWVLRVRQTDSAGNVGVANVSTGYVVDTTAPSAPVVTAPASPGRATSPSWSATYEGGATTECKLTSGTAGGPVVTDWAPCVLPIVTDLSSRADGTYVLSVRASDAVGLTSPAGSASYLLDTTLPAAPVFTAQTASPGRTKAVSFSFTAETGATVLCKLTSGATLISPETTCTSPLPVDLTTLPDGPYTVSAHAVDAAGNSGPTQTATYVLDTTNPAPPALVTGPAAIGSDRTPTWAFTAEAGATVTCKVTGAASSFAVSASPCTSPFSASLTSQPDDTYTFTATARDAAGNVSGPLTLTYVLDATAPSTATIVGPSSPGKNTTPAWQVSSTDGGTIQCQLIRGAATLVRDWATCGPTFQLGTALTEGTYTLSARVLDAAGNISPEAKSVYVLDTTAPAAARITTPANPSTDRNPTFTVSSPDAGVTASCQVVGPAGPLAAAAPCAISAAGSPFDLNLTTAADGAYTLTVSVKDAAGNAGPDARGTYVLDTAVPNAVLVTAPQTPSSVATPTWSLVGDSDATLLCRLSGPGLPLAPLAPCATVPGVPGAGSFTADLTAKADGTYTLTVASRDAAGNLGPETSSSYLLDTTPPVTPAAPTVTPTSPSQTSVVTWSFDIEPGATALCTLSRATSVTLPEAPCTSPFATSLPSDGTYTLTVRAQDAAHNLSGSSATTYTLDTIKPLPPTITGTPGSPGPESKPTWSVVAAEPGGTLECWLTGVDIGWRACPSPLQYDLSPALTGTYLLQVHQVDAAGNVSDTAVPPAPYVYDSALPPTPIIDAPKSPSSGTHPVFTITRAVGDTDTVTLVCTVKVLDQPATTVPCDFGPLVVDLSAITVFRDGPVTLTVHGVDLANNPSGDAASTYLFDNTPPVSPTVSLPSALGLSPKVPVTFGTDEDVFRLDPVTYQCAFAKRFDVVAPVRSVPCVSPRDVTLPAPGEWTLWVWSVDVAGNFSDAAVVDYTLLPAVPVVTGIKAPPNGPDTTPTWTFAVPRGFTATCVVSGATGTTVATGDCSSGRFTPDLANQPGGLYTLTVQLTDTHDNKGRYSTRSVYRFVPSTKGDTILGYKPPTKPTRPGPGPDPGPGNDPGPADNPGPGPGTTPVPPSSGNDPLPPRGPQIVTPVPGSPEGNSSSKGGSSPDNKNNNALGPIRGLTREVPDAIGQTLRQVAQKPTIPLLLLVVVVGFLLLQNRIDRRDPKLASAPVGAEPELDFGPVQGFRNLGGGAPA
jgi:hypothetical protein